ncbi:MAG: glutamine--fructose-6-phosphate transaminase (isomerizing) [Chloroflexi bacterium]|nr:glutamine--fructose-6-phosphate transaminase (isomerizing) [Chloroflexota bacterium]MCI0856796.1 glutamine--fructose-6-phosphate transaminase (isomerizing) [Chloroflexota bacterium]
MCGIIAYAGTREASPLLLEGLQRLEYRGYDSAGIAVFDSDGQLHLKKQQGKIAKLTASLEGVHLPGTIGLAHTRWATHGKPSDENAHPQQDCGEDVAVVHNGIVENYLDLGQELMAQGHGLTSETDTEVLAHLIETNLNNGDDLHEALRNTIARIDGSHAIVAFSKNEPDRLVAARVGNAGGVVIGYGENEHFIASDLPALLPETHRVVFLGDGELAEVTREGVRYWDAEGNPIDKEPQTVPLDPVAAAKGVYKHFMLKEIVEQPQCVLDTFRGRVLFDPPSVQLDDFDIADDTLRSIERIVLIAMGTSLHAAMVGQRYFEELAGIPTEVDNASEFRYRSAIVGPETLVVSVAQSGETVDTLEAMHEVKRRGSPQVTICNTPGAESTRVADATVYTRCGPEIAVASSKTLTASMIALYLLACHIGRVRGRLDEAKLAELTEPLAHLPDLMGRVLHKAPAIEELAHQFQSYHHFLFLARGLQYPVALEGALKLKELSYIHAEGYPAGEMKHGPIALIDEQMPTIAIAVRDGMREKMLSNIEQVQARDGTVIALVNEGDTEMARKADHVIEVPETTPLLLPILTVLPLQLFAYHIAVWRGCDVDQPRNLAKTVTVE